MTKKELLLNLFARALLDIRIAAHESQANRAFHIADLFHNIPYMLLEADSELGYENILTAIYSRAGEKGIGDWLDNALTDLGVPKSEKREEM